MFNFHSFRDILGCYLTTQLGVKYKPHYNLFKGRYNITRRLRYVKGTKHKNRNA